MPGLCATFLYAGDPLRGSKRPKNQFYDHFRPWVPIFWLFWATLSGSPGFAMWCLVLTQPFQTQGTQSGAQNDQKVNFWAIFRPQNSKFWPFWAAEWDTWVWKGCVRTRYHMATLWTLHMPIFGREKIWPKMRNQKLGFGVHNCRKIDFLAVLSLWVGPLRLKRLQKDRASHGIALDTPHAYILKKKNWPKTGPPNLGFRVRNGPKMVKSDPNAYNLHGFKLFDQLLPTFHWF